MESKKQLPHRWARLVLAAIMLVTLVSSCAGDSGTKPVITNTGYASYRDVPGVTEAEIKAIDDLREQYGSFVYGAVLSTEAFTTAEGEICGYTALLCKWLSTFFDIPFTPALYEWGEIMSGLKSGAIDFNGDIGPSNELLTDNYYKCYMSGAIANHAVSYFRIEGSPAMLELSRERKPRLVAYTGSVTYQKLESLIGSENFEITFADDSAAVYNMLKSGEADAFIEDDYLIAAFDSYGDVVAETLYPLTYGGVSLTTLTPALAPIISVVQKAMQNGAIQELTALYNEGQQDYLHNKLYNMLTDEEKAYIRQNPVVSFIAEYDNYPICFFNTQEKQWQGITFDVLDQINILTGLSFNVINTGAVEWPEMVSMLERGDIPMLTELVRTKEREGLFIWPRHTILTDNYALISKLEFHNINANEILDMRIGLPAGTAFTDAFMSWFPYHENTIIYGSSEAAFAALARGEIDMVMSSQYRFLLLTNFREIPGYKANFIFDRTFDSTFGFNKNETVLCSIVDKALGLIDTKTISGQWMRKTYDYRAKLLQGQIPWIIGASLLSLILLLSLYVAVRSRHDKRRLVSAVEMRTAEIREMVEKQARTEAESAAKTAFLANMSHEIRTPMNSIIGFAELALGREMPPDIRKYVGMINENAGWLLQIINDILDLSKVESGILELENIPFDLFDLFGNCVSAVMPKAIEKNIDLHSHAEPLIGKMVLGDPGKLRQVLLNILSNAVKFTDMGAVALSARIVDETESYVTVRFIITDTGIGMTTDQVRQIFEPFMQADISTTRKYGGTGLGLPITKSILDLMGSAIEIETEEDAGTKIEFTLTFKKVGVPDASEAAGAEPGEAGALEKPFFKGEVLVCEDNQMNQRVISEHLSRVGLDFVIAENGQEALMQVRERGANGKKPFDLILMDIQMPVMDGMDAAREINELGAGTPIVAVTANITAENRELYKQAGMLDCIGKPFTSQELWRCLLRYLKPAVCAGTGFDDAKARDTDLRETLKHEFVKSNRNKFDDIMNALETDDISLGRRLAHTLKSNAGLIGMTALQKAAAEVESMLAGGTNHVARPQLDTLQAELTAALDALTPYADEAKAREGEEKATAVQAGEGMFSLSGGLCIEKALELLDILAPLLDSGNPKCLDYVGELSLLPGSSELIEQMEDYYFAAAAETLAKFRQGLEAAR